MSDRPPLRLVIPGFLTPGGTCRRCPTVIETGYLCPTCADEVRAEQRARDLALMIQGSQRRMQRLEGLHSPTLVAASPGLADPAMVVDRWNGVAHRWAKSWAMGSGGAWLFGGAGSGKSWIAAGLVQRVIERGFTACMTPLQTILTKLEQLRFSRTDPNALPRALDALGSVDLLVLDDVLASKVSPGELDQLLALLDRRGWEKRPIVCTANYTRTGGLRRCTEWWGREDHARADRIVSRLTATTGVEIPCVFPGDRRTGASDPSQIERLSRWADSEEPDAT